MLPFPVSLRARRKKSGAEHLRRAAPGPGPGPEPLSWSLPRAGDSDVDSAPPGPARRGRRAWACHGVQFLPAQASSSIPSSSGSSHGY